MSDAYSATALRDSSTQQPTPLATIVSAALESANKTEPQGDDANEPAPPEAKAAFSTTEEEEEPQLKYERLGGDVAETLKGARGSVLLSSSKVLVLGTSTGNLHIMDYSGTQVRRFPAHKAKVTALSFDEPAEYLGSASEDGTVSVRSLYNDELVAHNFKVAITALALDPRYGARKTREFITGSAAGTLTLSSAGWLGRNDHVVHSGEGRIDAVQWVGATVAWSNELGVRVYDTTVHQKLGRIDRPRGTGTAAATPCTSLLLEGEDTLLVAWPDCIKIVKIEQKGDAAVSRMVSVVRQLTPPFSVLGLAPCGADHLAVLTYEGEEDVSMPNGHPAPSPLDAASDAADATQQAGPDSDAQAGDANSSSAAAPGDDTVTSDKEAKPNGTTPPSHDANGSASANAHDAAATAASPAAPAQTPGPSPSAAAAPPAAPSPPAASASPDDIGAATATPPPSVAPATPTAPVPEITAVEGSPEAASTARPDPAADAADVQASTSSPPAALALRILHRITWSERSVDLLPLEADPGQPQDYALLSTHAVGTDGGYFVLAPHDVLWGKPRDSDDRVVWMLEHQRYDQALQLVEGDRSIKRVSREAVAASWLEQLVSAGSWGEAAALCPRLLRDSAALWERWVYTYAQARQLALLAPFLPTNSPKLRPTAYELVLQSLLLGPPEHHQLLLTLLRDWPTHLYSGNTVVEAINSRIRRAGGDSPLLWNVLAVVYQQQGRPDLALAIQLQMRSRAVFDFIRRQGPAPGLANKAALLMEIDEEDALALLVEFHELLPPGKVVPTLQDAIKQAQQQGEAANQLWRLRLHKYLQALFAADSLAGTEFHTLQVSLYAEFEPSGLMAFLAASQHYSLEAALQVVEGRGLLQEAVFILGRMGNATRALHILIEKLADIPQAIQFVRAQQDEELWDHLLSWALRSPVTVGQLLDLIGGVINPLRLIEQLPLGMEIPKLRDRLRHIIADFRTETSLREGCNNILRADCLLLVNRLYHEVRHALTNVYIQAEDGQHSGQAASWKLYECSSASMSSVDPSAAPSWLASTAARRSPAADLAGPSSSGAVSASASSSSLTDISSSGVRLWLGAGRGALSQEQEPQKDAKKTWPGRPAPSVRVAPANTLPSLLL